MQFTSKAGFIGFHILQPHVSDFWRQQCGNGPSGACCRSFKSGKESAGNVGRFLWGDSKSVIK